MLFLNLTFICEVNNRVGEMSCTHCVRVCVQEERYGYPLDIFSSLLTLCANAELNHSDVLHDNIFCAPRWYFETLSEGWLPHTKQSLQELPRQGCDKEPLVPQFILGDLESTMHRENSLFALRTMEKCWTAFKLLNSAAQEYNIDALKVGEPRLQTSTG